LLVCKEQKCVTVAAAGRYAGRRAPDCGSFENGSVDCGSSRHESPWKHVASRRGCAPDLTFGASTRLDAGVSLLVHEKSLPSAAVSAACPENTLRDSAIAWHVCVAGRWPPGYNPGQVIAGGARGLPRAESKPRDLIRVMPARESEPAPFASPAAISRRQFPAL
jgi:hypothetical protein